MNQLRCASKVRFVLAACLASVVILGVQSNVHAQQGKYVTEATVRLIKQIDAANKDGYNLPDNTFSLGGGWLKQSSKEYVGLFTVQLTEGKKYRFLAAGDADAKDVDLQVVHAESNKVVAEDAKVDPNASVDFSPTLSGRYLVRVRLFDSDKNLPCVCLAVVLSK